MTHRRTPRADAHPGGRHARRTTQDGRHGRRAALTLTLAAVVVGGTALAGVGAVRGDDGGPDRPAAARGPAAARTAGDEAVRPASAPTGHRIDTTAKNALTATHRDEEAKLDRVRTPRIDWWSCDQTHDEGQECATVEVPLDYDEPRGRTTRIALRRVPASDPDQRLGTLFLNPGGPGGSAVDMAEWSRWFLSDDLTARYDVVGVEPRGVGASDLVACFPDMRSNWSVLRDRAMWFPREGSEQAFVTASARLGQACSSHGKTLAGAVSTANVARDHELVRRALEDERFNFLGFSYGTHLGTVYANLFPSRVGAMVLDGAVDPAAWVGTRATRDVPMQLRGDAHVDAEEVLDEALRRCAEAGPERCVTATLGDPAEVWADVRARTRASDGVEMPWGSVTYAELIGSLGDALDEPRGAEAVDEIVSSVALVLDGAEAAEDLGGDDAVDRAAEYLRQRVTLARLHRSGPAATKPGRNPDKGGFPYVNGYEAYHAPMCADSLDPLRVEDVARAARTAAEQAPTFGPMLAWQSAACASRTWSVEDEDAYRGPFTSRTATPALVVGARWDATTSYAAAQRLAGLLPGAGFLASDSWGHTAYGTSECVTSAIDAYLLSRELPAADLECTGDHQPFAEEPGWEDGEVEFEDLGDDIVDAARGVPAETSGDGVPDHLPPVASTTPSTAGVGPTP